MENNETWLIETGDLIIAKKASVGYEQLNSIEKAIYCFWVIDYAVRNSGTLNPIEDIRPTAINELYCFSDDNGCVNLKSFLKNSTNGEEFCEIYYLVFEQICDEIRLLWVQNTAN